ncbi:hypothetical protein VM1G_11492 [Cytospora mali]|uniref:Uncharacterized protein n=1 Tax=Cytospora mali TaxID=578113 RepID=A0A194VTY9_CYTMA|nr:hypothetical protein VM1G_11492 [Valsa mali]
MAEGRRDRGLNPRPARQAGRQAGRQADRNATPVAGGVKERNRTWESYKTEHHHGIYGLAAAAAVPTHRDVS